VAAQAAGSERAAWVTTLRTCRMPKIAASATIGMLLAMASSTFTGQPAAWSPLAA